MYSLVLNHCIRESGVQRASQTPCGGASNVTDEVGGAGVWVMDDVVVV